MFAVAESVKAGIIEAGGSATIYQYVRFLLCDRSIDQIAHRTSRIPETLPDDILTKLHAPPKPIYPVITAEQLPDFDAFLFGIPTRFGNFPAQWKVGLVDSVGSAASRRRCHVVAKI